MERDRPPVHVLAPTLLNSVGITVAKTDTGIKFVYKNKQIISDLDQLGFSIEVLTLRGGETPLPVLAVHVEEQASLEAYWSAQAEQARYKYSVAEDSFNFWYESKYAKHFTQLQDRGVAKPIQKEVEGRIARLCGEELKRRKEKVRKLEYRYRMLSNACLASVATKGRMLQTLRNIIQGNGAGKIFLPSVDNEVIGGENDITAMKVKA